MRGPEEKQSSLLALISPSSIVPSDHPLRAIKERADAALKALSPQFDAMYAEGGRASIPPETLLKAQILIILYSVRSERQFCEQLSYNFLFRWFLDMDMVSPPFDATTFSKNRERLIKHEISQRFFQQVVQQADDEGLLSSEHFSVDGTLIEAWASTKSFVPKEEAAERRDDDDSRPPGNARQRRRARRERNAWKDFSGTKRTNETHVSTTDPEARMMRKGGGKEAKLSYGAHVLMENRNGFVVNGRVTEATGTAEREAGLEMLAEVQGSHKGTAGGDRGYDTQDFVEGCRRLGFTPHVAQNTTKRRSAIDRRTTRHSGYALSIKARMAIEGIIGWAKTIGGIRRTRFRGRERVAMHVDLVLAAYNLLRLIKLAPT